MILKSILREDLASFIHKCFKSLNPSSSFYPNWHIDLISEHLRPLESMRIVINMPPRSLKSLSISVAWPAWLLGIDPTKKIICASYSQTLSNKLSLDCRTIMQSKWYKDAFPKTIIRRDQNQKSKFSTTLGGFRIATSVGGSITGEGADVIIVDDPHNPTHIHSDKRRDKVLQWYEQTLVSRLNNQEKGSIIIVMQRLHVEDLSGYILDNKKGWQQLKLPSIFSKNEEFICNKLLIQKHKNEVLNPNHTSLDTLYKIRSEIGNKNFETQYQQSPLNNEKGLIKKFNYYSSLPDEYYVIHSWDTACKSLDSSDYSVCTIWYISDKYYLKEMVRVKYDYPSLKEKIISLYKRDMPNFIIIEDTGTGQALIQELKSCCPVKPMKPKFDKLTRFMMRLQIFETKVYIPSSEDDNINDFKNELTNFPYTKNDDIVDSTSQFLEFISSFNTVMRSI